MHTFWVAACGFRCFCSNRLCVKGWNQAVYSVLGSLDMLAVKQGRRGVLLLVAFAGVFWVMFV